MIHFLFCQFMSGSCLVLMLITLNEMFEHLIATRPYWVYNSLFFIQVNKEPNIFLARNTFALFRVALCHLRENNFM